MEWRRLLRYVRHQTLSPRNAGWGCRRTAASEARTADELGIDAALLVYLEYLE
jgi:hypothetical protein